GGPAGGGAAVPEVGVHGEPGNERHGNRDDQGTPEQPCPRRLFHVLHGGWPPSIRSRPAQASSSRLHLESSADRGAALSFPGHRLLVESTESPEKPARQILRARTRNCPGIVGAAA